MAHTPRKIAASARQRLLNPSKSLGTNYNQLLIRYAIERFLYRLSGFTPRDGFIEHGQRFEHHDLDAGALEDSSEFARQLRIAQLNLSRQAADAPGYAIRRIHHQRHIAFQRLG
jgi:hypothetical protein